VLVSGLWLYGTVNRREFERAVSGNDNHPTFRLSKRGWRASSAPEVVGSHVAAWDWLASAAPARRKRPAKAAGIRGANEHSGFAPLTNGQLTDLVAETAGLDDNAVAMLSVAAGVDSIDQLTQASLPAFREALAGYMAGVGR
jgi:hypothetical protein